MIENIVLDVKDEVFPIDIRCSHQILDEFQINKGGTIIKTTVLVVKEDKKPKNILFRRHIVIKSNRATLFDYEADERTEVLGYLRDLNDKLTREHSKAYIRERTKVWRAKKKEKPYIAKPVLKRQAVVTVVSENPDIFDLQDFVTYPYLIVKVKDGLTYTGPLPRSLKVG